MSADLLSCTRNGTAYTANATAAAVALSTVAGADVMPALWVYNPTGSLVRVKMGGDNTVQATSASVPVPPGEFQPFKIGSATHFSAWAASGNVGIELFAGAAQ